MCCFISALLLIGPRLAFLVYWLIPSTGLRVNLAFGNWIYPLLGLIFLPWTTLAYVLLFPVMDFEWAFVALAFAVDLSGIFGGFRSRRSGR